MADVFAGRLAVIVWDMIGVLGRQQLLFDYIPLLLGPGQLGWQTAERSPSS